MPEKFCLHRLQQFGTLEPMHPSRRRPGGAELQTGAAPPGGPSIGHAGGIDQSDPEGQGGKQHRRSRLVLGHLLGEIGD